MQVEIDETFWKLAEVICLKIMDAESGYRTPPEEVDARNQVVAEIKAMTRDHLLGAERLELQYLPGGWASLLRDVLMAALQLAREHDAPKLVILTGKEKFGELRIAFNKTGLGELDVKLTDLAAWAAVQSRTRCAGTGLPGQLNTDGWVIPLSADLAALKRSNQAAFRRAVTMFPVEDRAAQSKQPRGGKK